VKEQGTITETQSAKQLAIIPIDSLSVSAVVLPDMIQTSGYQSQQNNHHFPLVAGEADHDLLEEIDDEDDDDAGSVVFEEATNETQTAKAEEVPLDGGGSEPRSQGMTAGHGEAMATKKSTVGAPDEFIVHADGEESDEYDHEM